MLSSYPGISCLLHHSFLFLGSGFILGLLQCIPVILGIGQGEFLLLSRYCPLEVASSVCPPALPSWPMGRVPGHHQCIWCFLLGLPSWSLVHPELPQGGIFLPASLCQRRMGKGGGSPLDLLFAQCKGGWADGTSRPCGCWLLTGRFLLIQINQVRDGFTASQKGAILRVGLGSGFIPGGQIGGLNIFILFLLFCPYIPRGGRLIPCWSHV